MSLPSGPTPWSPVERLEDIEVRRRWGHLQVVDKRYWVELIDLPPPEAGALGILLIKAAKEQGWQPGT